MIRLKDYEEDLSYIQSMVISRVRSEAYLLNSMPVQDAIAHLISEGVREGLERLLEKQYTHEDFERDVGLKI